MKPIYKWIFALILFIWLFISLFPILWTLFTSLKIPADATCLPPKFLFSPTLTNYKRILFDSKNGFYYAEQSGFWLYFLNSTIVAIISTLSSLLLSITFSYYLVRFYRGSKISFWILSIRMLPPIAVIIPLYIMFNYIGIVDSLFSLILIYTVINLPLSIWLISSYMRKIPLIYDDIAIMDGLKSWQILWKVIFPLSKPAILTSGLLSFIFSWNEFLFALILTGTKSKTLPVLATGFITQREIQWGELTATAIIMIIPIFVLTLFLQKYITNGLSLGLKNIK